MIGIRNHHLDRMQHDLEVAHWEQNQLSVKLQDAEQEVDCLTSNFNQEPQSLVLEEELKAALVNQARYHMSLYHLANHIQELNCNNIHLVMEQLTIVVAAQIQEIEILIMVFMM